MPVKSHHPVQEHRNRRVILNHRSLGIALSLTVLGIAGCKDLVGNPALPAGIEDPSVYNTPAGALRFAQGATEALRTQTMAYMIASGILTDELTSAGNFTQGNDSLDARLLTETSNRSSTSANTSVVLYQSLQSLRGQARIARGVVQKYAPDAPQSLRGKLYAIEGYTIVELADLYCSGVPLSTIDFERDFTYQPGSSTTELYNAAIAMYDSALAFADTDSQVLTFARVGKGRALLNLGRYAEAAQAVADVPDGVAFTLSVSMSEAAYEPVVHLVSYGTLADHEGSNGLSFLSSGDPRSSFDTVTVSSRGTPILVRYPNKYRTANTGQSVPDSTTFVFADWIEARLIQAEAALQGGDAAGWKAGLDHIRATAMVNGVTGAIPPVVDPGTLAARVDTLFADRAEWLYLTGHRQGDLRRLVRQYRRPQNHVYPTGGYPVLGSYGSDVNAPVPVKERVNPLFHGCFNRDA